MAKSRRKKLKKEMRSEIKGILLLALAVVAIIGLFSPDKTGSFGIFLNRFLQSLAGRGAAAIPLIGLVLAIKSFLPANRSRWKHRFFGLLFLLMLYISWHHLHLLIGLFPALPGSGFFMESLRLGAAGEGGGVLGALPASLLYLLLGPTGSMIALAAMVFIAIILLFDLSLKKVVRAIIDFFCAIASHILYLISVFGRMIAKTGQSIQGSIRSYAVERAAQIKENRESKYSEVIDSPVVRAEPTKEVATEETPRHVLSQELSEKLAIPEKGSVDRAETERPGQMTAEKALEELKPAQVTPGEKRHSEYIFPPLSLLSLPGNSAGQQERSSREKAKLLEATLASFGVRAKVVHIQSGPTVTRFEVQPEAGVKVSRISSLSDDLALNLAAPLVRIEAPIPGKAALGIEVPNKDISLVGVREVMEDRTFQDSSSPLTIALGKDITGGAVIADLTKMPHLLIAGATGAGKSVCLNTIIASILYKACPERVRFMMIDPKVVELSIYNGISHLLMPVVTDPRKASLALRNMVKEMGRRYDMFAKIGVRDIGSYNELAEQEEDWEKLAYIVVIIDELADLMLVSPGEVEDSIARLAQMSRAAGIHLLVATQRPSVDVLTGIIKANITSRIAFTVSSQFDSRTILDMAGAEKLLGRGDMLFYPVGTVKPFRVQGAYISEVEIKKVTDFIKEQGNPEYDDQSDFLSPAEEDGEEEADALFAEAIDLVVRTGQASISLLQRRFRIGYTRAARLIDDLERKGIVGKFEGSKPREVLVTEEQAEQICKDFLNQQQ